MAIRTSCCLNLPPKPSSSSPYFPSKTSQFPCIIKKDEVVEGSNKRIGGVAGLIIGLEMVSLVLMGRSTESNGQYYANIAATNAIAKQQQQQQQQLVVAVVEEVVAVVVEPSKSEHVIRLAKWSDRIRVCPPWHLNSLESIVPENLPRPSTRRRLESAAHPHDAPPPKSNSNHHAGHVRGSTADCFSL
ncbi:histone deacetylase-like protein [Parasponia andersonii]|uniref:Histone deacetylase-like protein n=1 Tax=Parasponia andersonii TaxID=3476 RepID=A0A2P5CA81_PARAD|nr:histone deacetylase-like protein [Parasponia andersonii]